jgi:hypothetical protein
VSDRVDAISADPHGGPTTAVRIPRPLPPGVLTERNPFDLLRKEEDAADPAQEEEIEGPAAVGFNPAPVPGEEDEIQEAHGDAALPAAPADPAADDE